MALDPVAQRYAQTLFTDKLELLTSEHGTEAARVRAELARRGLFPNTAGQYHSEMTRIDIEHFGKIADARADTLLEAYKRAKLPIDDRAVVDICLEVERICEAQERNLVGNIHQQVNEAGLPQQVAGQMADVIANGVAAIKARINRRLSAKRDEEILAARSMPRSQVVAAAGSRRNRNLIIRVWHMSARWQWYAGLFCAAFLMVSIQEYLFGVLLLIVSAMSLISKLMHWNGRGAVKYLGAAAIASALVAFIFIILAVKGKSPWSHLQEPLAGFVDFKPAGSVAPKVISPPDFHASHKEPSDTTPPIAKPLIDTQSSTSLEAPKRIATRQALSRVSNDKKVAENKTTGNTPDVGGDRREKTSSAPVAEFNSAPNGIAISGGNVTNPTVNNFSPPERHLTPAQTEELDMLAESLPDSTVQWLTVEAENDPESSTYGSEIRAVFATRNKVKGNDLTLRLVERPPVPRGVYVLVSGEKDHNFSLAQDIANRFAQVGIPVTFARGSDLEEGQVKIVIGYRP